MVQYCDHLMNWKLLQWFPEPLNGLSGRTVGFTIMGKIADRTFVQKTVIDTLHNEVKPQKVITEASVHRVLYPSLWLESWVEGKGVVEKDAQAITITGRSLVRIVKQILFKNLTEIRIQGLDVAGVSGSRAATHRHIQDMGSNWCIPCVKPLLN